MFFLHSLLFLPGYYSVIEATSCLFTRPPEGPERGLPPPNVMTNDGSWNGLFGTSAWITCGWTNIVFWERAESHAVDKWKRSSSTWGMEWVYNKQHLVGEALKTEQKVTKVDLSSRPWMTLAQKYLHGLLRGDDGVGIKPLGRVWLTGVGNRLLLRKDQPKNIQSASWFICAVPGSTLWGHNMITNRETQLG